MNDDLPTGYPHRTIFGTTTYTRASDYLRAQTNERQRVATINRQLATLEKLLGHPIDRYEQAIPGLIEVTATLAERVMALEAPVTEPDEMVVPIPELLGRLLPGRVIHDPTDPRLLADALVALAAIVLDEQAHP